MKSGYNIFLTIELARLKKIIPNDLEYDLMWETGCGLYDEFFQSTFNKPAVGLYDCLSDFLNTKK